LRVRGGRGGGGEPRPWYIFYAINNLCN
jgi:hypothetical protein